MYKLKQIPEDFIVKEWLDLNLSKGSYGYYILRKKDLTTTDAADIIAKKFNVPISSVGYAGAKDKTSISDQYISIKGVKNKSFRTDNMGITYIGEGSEPICLGDLSKNCFELVIRNIEKKPDEVRFIPNYFDDQRFSKNNFEIGLAIIKKDFKRAAELIDNNIVKESINANPNDPISAIKLITKRIAMLYIHSVQSFIWNEAIASLLKDEFDDFYEVPYSKGKMVFTKEKLDKNVELVGFGTEFKDIDVEGITNVLLSEYDIRPRDFIINQIPNLSSEGSIRSMFVDVGELIIKELEDDDLNKGMKKCKVFFTVPKGSYATVVVKAMFKE